MHGDDISVNARTVVKMLQTGAVQTWSDPTHVVSICRGRNRHRHVTYHATERRIVISLGESTSYTLLDRDDPYLLAVESLSRGDLMLLCERLGIQGKPHLPDVVRKLRERDRAKAAAMRAA